MCLVWNGCGYLQVMVLVLLVCFCGCYCAVKNPEVRSGMCVNVVRRLTHNVTETRWSTDMLCTMPHVVWLELQACQA